MPRLTTETDVHSEQRALSPDELDRLIRAAGTSKRKRRDLASRTAHSFELDGNPPTVRVGACYARHRGTDVMPLAEDLVTRLRE